MVTESLPNLRKISAPTKMIGPNIPKVAFSFLIRFVIVAGSAEGGHRATLPSIQLSAGNNYIEKSP